MEEQEGLAIHPLGRGMTTRIPWLLAVLLLTCGAYGVRAQTPLGECPKPVATSFDGTGALTYAVFAPGAGSDLQVHTSASTGCAHQNGVACRAGIALKPGDVLAIGATCGNGDYVQQMASDRVDVGWIDDSGPTGKSPLVLKPGSRQEEDGLAFRLTRGKGVPVCEAYLQRINAQPSDRSPYCGFPEETRVPGFGHLTREWMNWTDIKNVDDDLSLFVGQGRISTDHRKTPVLYRAPPGVYRFRGGVDIENNGQPDNVLMWSFEGRNAYTCGQYFGTVPEMDKHGSVGVILAADGKSIDVERTGRVFGSRHGGYDVTAGHPPRREFQSSYTPIGLGYTLFEYRGVYYYSTFQSMWYDFDDTQSRASKDEDILGVFRSKGGVTTKVCEFRPPVTH